MIKSYACLDYTVTLRAAGPGVFFFHGGFGFILHSDQIECSGATCGEKIFSALGHIEMAAIDHLKMDIGDDCAVFEKWFLS